MKCEVTGADFILIPQPQVLRRLAVRSSHNRQSTGFSKTFSRKVDRVSWLLFLLCCVIRWPSLTMAAPVHSTDEPVVDVTEEMATTESIADDSVMEEPQLPPASPGDRFRDARPKWVNPCGGVIDDVDPESPVLSDAEVARNAVLDINIALDQIQNFKDNFVRSAFRATFADVARTWDHVHYDWLPADDVLPKAVGQELPESHFESLEFGPTLKSLFLALQKVAVGLEQVVLDRAVYGGDFLEHFANTETKMGMVLCALQLAMAEKNVVPDADAARQLMTRQYRDMRSASGRNLRDFIIIRDYTNLLEYIQQVFQYFASRSS